MINSDNGVVYEGKFFFDPYRKTKEGLVLISHAHSDHLKKHDAQMVMTPATQQLAGFQATLVDYESTKKFDDYELSTFDAGHILGSAQFRLDDLVYTGDFSMMDSNLFHGAKALEADTLVMETTFGLKDFVFPEKEVVYEEMRSWIQTNYDHDRIVVLGGYALGKAQELTKLVTGMGLVPVVHSKVARVNKVYEEHGLRLGNYVESSSEEAKELMKNNFVAILPQNMISENLLRTLQNQYCKKVVSAVATGWAGVFSFRKKGVDKAFLLSDHADYKQLLDYVREANPRKVFTIHGYAKEFARQLRREGFNAAELKKSKQTSLNQW